MVRGSWTDLRVVAVAVGGGGGDGREGQVRALLC